MKSPPHLELCVIPLFLERVDAEERKFIRSAPQNAILSHAAQGSQTQGFQNHIPARGRKPDMLHVCPKHIGYFKTTSPQGDGNRFASDGFKRVNSPISKPHPRKGTETNNLRLSSITLCISKPYPRKGTETVLKLPFHFLIHYFKTTSPQGDGTHEGRLHEAKNFV